MDKTVIQSIMDKTCDKMHERLNHLLSFDVEQMDCDDIREIHYIWEIMKIIRDMR